MIQILELFGGIGAPRCALRNLGVPEINLYEPTCGAGGMIIGYARVLFEKEINFQSRLKVMAQDLDTLCVHMTYVQLSLMGINAVVAQGDSLEEKFDEIPENRRLRTPKNLYFF